jgi:hypothetical protein
MGHVQTAFATKISTNLNAAVRYDLNLYSGDSDIALGLSHTCRDNLFENKVLLRCSARHGFAFSLNMNNEKDKHRPKKSESCSETTLNTLKNTKDTIMSSQERSSPSALDQPHRLLNDDEKSKIDMCICIATGPLVNKTSQTESINTPLQFALKPIISFRLSIER